MTRNPIAACILLAVAIAPSAAARVQGAKGRRLQVFHGLEPYRGGLVLLEEPEVVSGSERKVVRDEHLRWCVHEFLETRLRELPWTVEPWLDEFGPVAEQATQTPTLVVDSTLFVEGRRLALELFLRDLDSGRVVARYQGYGRSLVRTVWPGARDDLQEMSRVLVQYLAQELKVGQPDWMGYEPAPYRRRDRSDVGYSMLRVDKDRDLPRALHHRDPPINDEARERREPLEVELREPGQAGQARR